MKTRIPASLTLALLLPFTMATKCVEYDRGLTVAGPGPSDGGTSATGKACDQPNVARLRAENFAFKIQCGCAEQEGKICTVPLGTTIHWQFADSTNHNITSVANAFGMSADTLSGTFTYTFTTAGSHTYGCSIHSLDMSGYQVVVKEGGR